MWGGGNQDLAVDVDHQDQLSGDGSAYVSREMANGWVETNCSLLVEI